MTANQEPLFKFDKNSVAEAEKLQQKAMEVRAELERRDAIYKKTSAKPEQLSKQADKAKAAEQEEDIAEQERSQRKLAMEADFKPSHQDYEVLRKELEKWKAVVTILAS